MSETRLRPNTVVDSKHYAKSSAGKGDPARVVVQLASLPDPPYSAVFITAQRYTLEGLTGMLGEGCANAVNRWSPRDRDVLKVPLT